MSVKLESAERYEALKSSIEAVTGETHADLTDGIQALKNGYGQGGVKEEQEKTIDITENGTTEVLPDDGKVLSKVTVNVEVSSGGSEVPSNAKFQVVSYTTDGYPLEVNICSEGDTSTPQYCITPRIDYVSTFLSTIRKVNLPSTVVQISIGAFMGATKLNEVTGWDNVTAIGTSAFESCSSLTHTSLPPNLTHISNNVFANARVPINYLPESVKHIGGNAFYRVSGMNLKKLPQSLTTIVDYAFYNTGYANVSFSEIPASVQTIGTQAFRGACLGIVGSLTFKGTPTSIAASAFEMGTNVTDVYVPWAEGAVAGAPWGMTNATIHYESEV